MRRGPQGSPVEWVEEKSYFFKLSAYQDRLLALYESQPDFIGPDSRRNEVVSFVKGGLKDLSISRTTFDWGVKVPDDPEHVMYVWVDALTNYITGVGFPDESDANWRYWPADVHIIGKDIIRFHAVYWPAFLMSAGIPVQKRVYAHGFLFSRGEKMSKSVGNVVDPFNLADQYGVDQMRYFFLREVPFGQDGNYNHEAMVARINADLANDLGNLAQRSLSMIAKQLGGVLPEPGEFTDNDKEILAEADAMLAASRTAMATQQIHQWLNAVWAVVAEANRYFAGEAPWALAKTDPARQKTVLYVTAEVVRQVAILAQPVMPDASSKLLDSLGVPARGARDFAALGTRIKAGSNPAGAGRRVSALRRTKGGLSGLQAMLVDSHCHLDFPDFAEDLDAIVARAETAGIGRIVTISTRVKRLGGLLAIAERFPNVYCSVGTHPHHADEEDGIPASELIELTKHPKVVALGEAGLDYFYEHGSREAQERGFRAHIAAARATGLPLVIHTRDADEDCGRILEDEMAKGPFRAVLHCYTGGRELAMKAIASGAVDLVHGHFDVQEVAKPCANSRPNCRPTASWSKPTRRIWRPASSAASATSRPTWSKSQKCWRKRAASRWKRSRGRRRKTSSGCFQKCRRRRPRHDGDADDPRLRLIRRRAASGARLGRLRSQQSEKPPPPLLAAGRAHGRARHHADRDRHLARPARAVDRRQCRSHRRGVPDP